MSSKRQYVFRSSGSRVFVITGLIFIFSQPASAQSLLGNSVLQLSPSAVANGMGNGFAAASTEASAIHYNPAALTRVGRFAIEGNTFELFQGARYHHVAGAFQAPFCKRLWLGAAYSRIGMTSSIYELDADFKPIRRIESQSDEWALSFAAAAKISRHFSVGAGFKHERSIHNFGTEPLGEFSNYALDLGLLYEGLLPSAHLSRRNERRPWPRQKWARNGLPPSFSFGVTLANIGLKSQSDGAGKELLRQIDIDPSLSPVYVNPEIDGALPHDFLLQKLHVGLAWNFFESNAIGLVATGEAAKPLNEIAERCNGTFIGDRAENEPTFAGGDVSYNAFGFSIGPPGLRFSYAKIFYDDNILLRDRQIFTAVIVLDKLPF